MTPPPPPPAARALIATFVSFVKRPPQSLGLPPAGAENARTAVVAQRAELQERHDDRYRAFFLSHARTPHPPRICPRQHTHTHTHWHQAPNAAPQNLAGRAGDHARVWTAFVHVSL